MSGTSTVDRLRDAGERVTRQRLQVADALAAEARQVTAGELWQRMRRGDRRIGRATVFRTLEALVTAGVARRLELDGHVYGYVACRPEHHHHLACDRCGQVVEIGEQYIRPVADRVAADLGFTIDDGRIDFYGLCADCATRQGSPRGG
ncbi:MAG TPA: Fur family transcriptional regulator [Candidatus Limnocylindria bacterium]|nr:Fur family transcriptional regulator [Candidatus Limnocylindria bacterium]